MIEVIVIRSMMKYEELKKILTGKCNINRIYVCSPLSSKTRAGKMFNMLAARDKCNVLNGMFRGYNIKAWGPHTYLPIFLDDNIPSERMAAMRLGADLLKMSDIIYVFGSKLSDGMKSEIEFAILNKISIVVEDNISKELKTFIQEME